MSSEKRFKEARHKAPALGYTKSRINFHQSVNSEIDMVMLTFAAEALLENYTNETPWDVGLLSTERLAIEKGLVRLPKSSFGPPSEVSPAKKVPSDVEGCTSSASGTESVTDRTNIAEEESSFQQSFIPNTILAKIFCFIRWQDILPIRGVSKQFFQQSLSFVAFYRLPHHRTTAIFLPCREDFQAHEAAVETELSPNRGQWMCNVCGLLNHSRALCGNTHCRSSRSLSTSSGYRMFLGQLRRDATAPMVKWLVNSVFQVSDSLISVENHRNKVTNRGKGCAWVTLVNESAGAKLVDYHHRIFFDTVCGLEGVWMVPRGHEKELAEFVKYQGSLSDRPKYMPRNTLVVEKTVSIGQNESRKAAPLSHQKEQRRGALPPPYDFPRPTPLPQKSFIKQGRWYHDPYHPIGVLPIHYY